jgi:hypothetical protein
LLFDLSRAKFSRFLKFQNRFWRKIMPDEKFWIAPARLREQRQGLMPPECTFWPSAGIPPAPGREAEFEANERARRAECDEFRKRWLNGESIEEIRRDIQRRNAETAKNAG